MPKWPYLLIIAFVMIFGLWPVAVVFFVLGAIVSFLITYYTAVDNWLACLILVYVGEYLAITTFIGFCAHKTSTRHSGSP